MINLDELTIKKAHKSIKTGEYTCVDLAKRYLEEIKKKNGELNAYLEVFDDVLEQAKESQKRFDDGTATLLTGIPFAIKDNILIKGRTVTAGSKILEGYSATYDATVIKKLKEQGVVFLGRTNMDEFAMGSSTENPAFGVTKNPHDTSRVAGGSSGGSACAVSANMSLVSLGTETGGSIRQPASLCGVVGLKTTYGRVSRYGAIAMGSSLDQIGPFAKNIDDVEIVYDAIKGQDTNDSTTISENTYSVKQVGKKKPVVGVLKFTKEGVDSDIMKTFDLNVEKLKKSGYEIEEIKPGNIDYSLAIYYVIMPAEVSSNLARFDGMRFGLHKDGIDGIDDYFETRGEGFGKEVRRRIFLGTYVLSSGYYDAYYNRANILRKTITDYLTKTFEKVDMIITPTTPTPAFKIGEKTSDPIAMYLEDIFTVTANITGIPAISVPSGFSEVDGKKLPLGLQIMSAHGNEKILFDTAKDFLEEK